MKNRSQNKSVTEVFPEFRNHYKVPVYGSLTSDLKLSDDAFCISFLNYYYVNKKAELD
jgi:hypothetical protein